MLLAVLPDPGLVSGSHPCWKALWPLRKWRFSIRVFVFELILLHWLMEAIDSAELVEDFFFLFFLKLLLF